MGRWLGCVLLSMVACTRGNPWFHVATDDEGGAGTTIDAGTSGGPGEPMTTSVSATTGGVIDPDTSGDPPDPSTTGEPTATVTGYPFTSSETGAPGTSSTSSEPGTASTGETTSGESTDTGDSTSEGGECLVCGTPNCGACPVGPMVGFDGEFEIDAYEVTNLQYADFLEIKVGPALQSPSCGWNEDFTPLVWPLQAELIHVPVVGVDWCDAYAYCKWAGKRLCGAIGGGPGGYGLLQVKNADTDQWYRACSGMNGNLYPYGPTSVDAKCNDSYAMKGGPIDVGTMPGCEGSSSGLFDMGGNVWELTDACIGPEDNADCLRRGGSFMSVKMMDEADPMRCDVFSHRPRKTRLDHVGFRCCADL